MLRQTFGKDKRWVNWKLETVNGDLTKVPYNPHTKHKAKSNDQSTWGTYDEAKSSYENVGILLYDKKLICIDIDHCIENGEVIHSMKREIEDFIELSNSYTEISQSNTGLHIFMIIAEPYHVIAKKHEPWEIYSSGRFMAVTENIYKNREKIRTVTTDEMTSILETTGYPWGKTEEIVAPTLSYSTSTTLTDQEVLDIMFNAKNGGKIRQLYNTTGAKGSSEDDISLCTHLAFYCDGYDQIERIWVSSPLGQRQKTAKREDYRKATITKAMKSCTDHYSPTVQTIKSKEFIREMPEELKLVEDHKGQPVMNTENIVRILKGHPEFKGKLRYDSFRNILEIHRNDRWEEMKDHESINIQTRISVLFPLFAKVSKLMTEDALNKVIHDNEIDSASDYFKSLKWDGVPRLDTWLCKAFGVNDDEYHRAIGSNYLKGLAKRAREPGSKFDYVLVLEGSQGVMKTTALEELGKFNDYNAHTEITMSAGSKDFLMAFKGKLIVEFSEGETLSRSETKQLKSIITTRYDNYREPYGRKSKDHPRQCVFAMTTNEDNYLKDDTGNRRWLPVKVMSEVCDIEWIKNNREQLYAEAHYRVMELKETTWEFPKELLEQAQDDRRVEDTNADLVLAWYKGLYQTQRDNGITVRDAFNGAIRSLETFKSFDKLEEMRIGGVLKGFLKLQKERTGTGTNRNTKWYDRKGLHEVTKEKKEEELKEQQQFADFEEQKTYQTN